MAEPTPLLQVRGLTRRFGGLLAVSDLDLAVYPGEILGLIGPNGAGKSTTFAMIAGAIAPSAGEIFFKGQSLTGQPTHAFAARGIVRTFQHNKPFDSMGAQTTMITSSAHKAQDALRLGADGVLLSSDAAAMQAMANQFDFLLNTIPVYHDYNVYLPLLKVDGTMCIVGTIGMNAELNARSLIMGRRKIAGSLVGGIQETQEMLDFCAQHQILSDIEMIPMDGINQAYERMQHSDVKYRFVIDMATLT